MSVFENLKQRFSGFATVSNLLLAAVVIGIGAFFAPWWKPIWLDEGLHYSMGAMSFKEALQTIDFTTIELNHGQTGVYMLVDWALMQVFGANLFALRLPSILAALILLWALLLFFRGRSLHWFWQVVGLLAVASTPFFIYFLGEARPYMPLAASAVCMLAFFSAPNWQRQTISLQFIGVCGILAGAIFHPYWIYFLVLTVAFGYLIKILDSERPRGYRENFRFFGGWMTIFGLLGFVIVGQLTWMRMVREFNYPPFEMIGGQENFWNSLLSAHVFGGWVTGALGLASLAILLLSPVRKSVLSLVPPIVLYLFAWASSIGVTVLSYLRGYWLFERQWVAGGILSTIAIVWFFAVLYLQLNQSRYWLYQVLPLLFVAAVFLNFFNAAISHLNQINSNKILMQGFANDPRTPTEIMLDRSDAGMVYGANVNSTRGGPVWNEFTDWYWAQAGMRPEFRESHPGWTSRIFNSEDQESTDP